jgi:ubiquinone/menaquinone biosynthesis C-methylase UbiE
MILRSLIIGKLEKLIGVISGQKKQSAEIKFWQKEIQRYLKWYRGELKDLYGYSPPSVNKVIAYTEELSAILTFFETHQKKKYLSDLLLEKDSFTGLKLLDIGSGPFPSALCFENCEVYSLDPLFDRYFAAGFPIHCYEPRGRFVQAKAEAIPFEDGYFDAVISVNAIDHVDDFEKTGKEIKRILKPIGRFRMHVHYHAKTTAEPIELNDEVFLKNYSWVSGLKKMRESKEKLGTVLTDPSEKYVVWGN